MNWFDYKNKKDLYKVSEFIKKSIDFDFTSSISLFSGYKYDINFPNEEQKNITRNELHFTLDNIVFLDE